MKKIPPKKLRTRFFDSLVFNISYVLICVIFCVTILIVQEMMRFYDDRYSWYSIVKMLVKILVPLFAAVTCLYTLTAKSLKSTWLISLSLFACFVAEILGSLGVDYNIVGFVVCHIALSIYFIKIKCFSKNDWKSLIPILIIYIAFVLFCYLWLIPYVETTLNRKVDFIFKLAVPIYGALLSFMLWRSFCTYGKQQWLLFSISATIFYLSDINVMMEGIIGWGATDPIALFTFTWITYPIALTLVSCFGRNTLHFFTFEKH
jgi:hypothetical protein